MRNSAFECLWCSPDALRCGSGCLLLPLVLYKTCSAPSAILSNAAASLSCEQQGVVNPLIASAKSSASVGVLYKRYLVSKITDNSDCSAPIGPFVDPAIAMPSARQDGPRVMRNGKEVQPLRLCCLAWTLHSLMMLSFRTVGKSNSNFFQLQGDCSALCSAQVLHS